MLNSVIQKCVFMIFIIEGLFNLLNKNNEESGRDSFVLMMLISLYWNLVSGLLLFLLSIYWLELQVKFVWVTSCCGRQGFVLWFSLKLFGLTWIAGLFSRHLLSTREMSRKQKTTSTVSSEPGHDFEWSTNSCREDKRESISFCKIWLKKDMENWDL